MLLLVSSAAIVVFYVVPNLSSLVFTGVPGLRDLGVWLDLNKAQAVLYQHHPTGRQWTQVLTAFLIWVALPGALGVVRVLRAEVKSS